MVDAFLRSAAVARLEGAVHEARARHGIVQVAGPSGTGKTTALHRVHTTLELDTEIIRVWPSMTAPQMAQEIAAATCWEPDRPAHHQLVRALRRHLAERERVLLVDDVHRGDASAFEMLVHFAEDPANLCTIVVAGWKSAHWPEPFDRARPDVAVRTVRFDVLSGQALLHELHAWDELFAAADDDVLTTLDERAGHGLLSNWAVIRDVLHAYFDYSEDSRLTARLAGAVIQKLREARR